MNYRVITPRSYNISSADRFLADQIMARAGFIPKEVCEIRVTESGIEIDWFRTVTNLEGRCLIIDPTRQTTRL